MGDLLLPHQVEKTMRRNRDVGVLLVVVGKDQGRIAAVAAFRHVHPDYDDTPVEYGQHGAAGRSAGRIAVVEDQVLGMEPVARVAVNVRAGDLPAMEIDRISSDGHDVGEIDGIRGVHANPPDFVADRFPQAKDCPVVPTVSLGIKGTRPNLFNPRLNGCRTVHIIGAKPGQVVRDFLRRGINHAVGGSQDDVPAHHGSSAT